MSNSRLVCLGLTLCDGVHQDLTSGKFTLNGMYFRLALPRFPIVHPMCVYACVTGGTGKTKLAMRLFDGHGQPVWEVEGSNTFDDPSIVLELASEIPDGILPAPGVYQLQLAAGHDIIMQRHIYVVEGPLQEI